MLCHSRHSVTGYWLINTFKTRESERQREWNKKGGGGGGGANGEERNKRKGELVSNWILRSCHYTGSAQDNQIHISNLFSCINLFSSHSAKPILMRQHTYWNIKHIFFKELVPSILPLLKEHIRPGHAGIIDHSVKFIDNRFRHGNWFERKTLKSGKCPHQNIKIYAI